MNRPAAVAGVCAGLVSALAGLSAGHLVAALTTPETSPVLSVGAFVIDQTPTPVKEWAVSTLGNADKPVLLGSVLLGTLLLAGAGGLVARRSFPAGSAVVLLLAGLAGAAALSRPVARPIDVVPALATAVVALLALRRLTPVPHRSADGPGRRRLLIDAGVIAGSSLVLASVGQWLVVRAREVGDVLLPRPLKPLPPLPRGLETKFRGLTPFQVPNEDFYRVDINLTTPVVDHESWRLRVDGMVDQPFDLSFDDLLALPMIETDITMCCVSNEVGGGYVGGARWLGVRVSDLLERAGVKAGADQILSTAVDGFTISTPLAAATDGRDMIVAVGMNGETLPRDHGFPARLVTPGLYGFVGGTKWLTRLSLTTYARRDSYWTKRGWATDAPVKIASRIDTPGGLKSVDSGRIVVAGVAWAPDRGIGSVEVSIDGGSWQVAELGPDGGLDYWRQWYLLWDAESGRHTLKVRARTLDGEYQSTKRATPFPDGSSGLQHIVVRVD